MYNEIYDTIIIGSGPAGITAALYIKRAGFKVLIISKNESSLNKAEKIENYYGFANPISGKELIENGKKQAKRLGIEIKEKEVIGIKYAEDNLYEIITSNQSPKEKYIARTVVIATGVNRPKPNIKGIKEYEGKGISYCAVCDAPFYKNKDVAVLGNGNYAIGEIQELLPIVKSITMLTNGKNYIQNRRSSHLEEKIQINEKEIDEFRGKDKIEEITYKDSTKQKINGIFIAQGTATSLDFAKKIGAKIENNYIQVDKTMQTTIPNIYACGDCTGGILQISKSISEATTAALAIINWGRVHLK